MSEEAGALAIVGAVEELTGWVAEAAGVAGIASGVLSANATMAINAHTEKKVF
ncbi:MAG: hypothetical protein HYR96_02595 [Deltaproteobacteria bacterium]|nr:hypothetical protein [Deltaproteobacteria bacterium]MBI3296261.1 hypothetical protein [Deltaproteobacteria bacterium]